MPQVQLDKRGVNLYHLLTAEFIEDIVRTEIAWLVTGSEHPDEVREAAKIVRAYYTIPGEGDGS